MGYLLKWGWIDLLSSIPLIPPLRVGRLARIVRILRLLRGVKSTTALIQELTRNRRQTATFTILLLTGTAVLQLSRLDLIIALLRCSDVPCPIDFRTIQVAPV